MKKSEIYHMLQVLVLNATDLEADLRIEMLKHLQSDEDLAVLVERSREAEKK